MKIIFVPIFTMKPNYNVNDKIKTIPVENGKAR